MKKKNRKDLLTQGADKPTGHIVIHIYESGSWHVDNQYFYGNKPPFPYKEKPVSGISPEIMVRVVKRTMEQGYWWASTAWAVVYRIYQMKGYTGGIKQFVREVEEWPFSSSIDYECNYDAVCKPIRSGKLTGTPDIWVKNGATAQYAILGTTLLKELQ